MHWEHRFNNMVGRYNDIYRVQMQNITPHVCRHTYCSNMAKSGMNPKTLQYLMGHSDIAVTLNVYTHVGLEDAEKEFQKMQGLENARKEMGLSDKDDKPLKQNMFKMVQNKNMIDSWHSGRNAWASAFCSIKIRYSENHYIQAFLLIVLRNNALKGIDKISLKVQNTYIRFQQNIRKDVTQNYRT